MTRSLSQTLPIGCIVVAITLLSEHLAPCVGGEMWVV